MFLDALLKLSENQALSGAGGLSTNVIDLHAMTPQRVESAMHTPRN